jgi:hypothetical protein
VGTLIIAAGNSLESILTSSIPNLKFNGFSIDINSSNLEINTNGWHEIIIENVILSEITLLEEELFVLTANLKRREDLPTPELPMRRTLKR